MGLEIVIVEEVPVVVTVVMVILCGAEGAMRVLKINPPGIGTIAAAAWATVIGPQLFISTEHTEFVANIVAAVTRCGV